MNKQLVRCFIAILFVFVASSVRAQALGRDMEYEKTLWNELAAIAPKSVETFKAATVALDKDDIPEATRLFESVVKQAPKFDAAVRRLGGCYVQSGRVQEGLVLMEQAVQIRRTPENLSNLAQGLAYPGGNKKATPAQMERAFSLAKEAAAGNKRNDASYLALVASLAGELDKFDEFRAASIEMDRRYPDAMLTHYFNAMRAAMNEDWVKSETEIRKAERLGLPSEAVNKFLASGVHAKVVEKETTATEWRYAIYSLIAVIVWGIGLGILFLLGKTLSGKTLRSIETDDPNQSVSPQQASLRRIYRTLINVAGLYYYISIPIVILLTIAVAGAVIYATLMTGFVFIKLVLLIGVGVVYTIINMIRSVLKRRKRVDPGRALTTEEAPGLWQLTREVAQVVNTRPVDEIRILPGADFAVYENGNFRQRRSDRAKRVLILGVALLNGFRTNPFRAILAHEYGHFTHRDTAGGDIAFQVKAGIMEMAIGMYKSRVSVKWNPAFIFLRVYNLLFRRITHGATRLQEVLADRVSVANYGAAAFEAGLTQVIRREIEFEVLATKEFNESYAARRAVQNVYNLVDTESTDSKSQIQEGIDKAMNRPTTEDDTHPGPKDRFRLASRIISKTELPADGNVWDLFLDREAITQEMNKLLEKEVFDARTS